MCDGGGHPSSRPPSSPHPRLSCAHLFQLCRWLGNAVLFSVQARILNAWVLVATCKKTRALNPTASPPTHTPPLKRGGLAGSTWACEPQPRLEPHPYPLSPRVCTPSAPSMPPLCPPLIFLKAARECSVKLYELLPLSSSNPPITPPSLLCRGWPVMINLRVSDYH